VSEAFRCELRTLSQIIRDEDVERIDLLKVDVEKSELDVLRGIDSSDWERIRQVVVEVQDTAGKLETIVRMLECRGFEVSVDQDKALEATGMFNVYARRAAEDLGAQRAFVTASARTCWAGAEAFSRELKSFAAARLPDYMVPSQIVLLDVFPMTPSGKLDRSALARLAADRLARRTAFVAPRTPLETTLASIWIELLGVERVGVSDSFFELGGHSLLATQVVSRIRDAFNIDLPLRLLFEDPTIEGLSRAVVQELIRNTEPAETWPEGSKA
jgi:acyl carrier protein